MCNFQVLGLLALHFVNFLTAQDVFGCGGFVKSEVEINFSLIEVMLYTKQGSLKYQTDCAPINGYYMIPVYDKGDYFLKVEPPAGWTFEPQTYELHIDGVNDKCSKAEDINFQFTGFGVVGKVVSKGQSDGPAGVKLALKKKGSNDLLKSATSKSDGSYTFEKVIPGEYVIEATHPKWQFETSSTSVTVSRETGNAGSAISIRGYDVKGAVLSDGEPIKGVKFVVYSSTVNSNDVTGCDKSDIKTLKSSKGQAPVCHVTSDIEGSFHFQALPSGKYRLVPIYVGEKIKFDVLPVELEFEVKHESVELKKPFQVAGFTVTGKVMTQAKGMMVAFAKVKVNGKEVTETKEDGTFTLDSMKAGTYKIDVESKNIFFDTKTVKVSPNNPELPDIIAARFSSCGLIKVDKFPNPVNPDLSKRLITVLKKDQSKPYREIFPERSGRFCTDLESGFYTFRVQITPEEVKAGLKLSPIEHEVEVKAAPTAEIVFSQMRAKIQGDITCLETCKQMQLSLTGIGRAERILTQVVVNGKEATFEFKDVMPGKYQVSILNEEWCWKEKTLDVEVIDQDITGIELVHNGYVLTCSLSHNLTLNFAHSSREDAGSFQVNKGINKFCLGQPGSYTLTPVSCHRFQQESYKFDTAVNGVLSLSALKHRVDGSITTDSHYSNIKLTIESSLNTNTPTVLFPLKADKEPVEEEKPSGSGNQKKQQKKTAKTPEEVKGPFTYRFEHWAKSNEKLEFIPSSEELLFYPATIEVTVLADRCMGEVATFEGRKGKFIEGQIKPQLKDVNIVITAQDDSAQTIDLQTDQKGSFRVGPLHPDVEYTVTAQKEGYIFTAVDAKLGHFYAFKLGEISVKVTDEADVPLQSVLLSLAGGSNYRSNNLTHKDGAIVFSSLSPGQYFLKPMMKEYRFEPTSQMIEVTEGSSLDIKVKGTRIAYSCYGKVTSLNGEPEQGILVEAVGLGSEQCTVLQEETKTEPDGGFRIRGLVPQCSYEVKLKTGDVNQHIERSAPKSKIVKAEHKDVENIQIIAFRRMNQLDITGNVVTPHEHLSYLKVSLYKESNPDSPIHTVSLSKTSFFHMPSLTRDNKAYFLKLTCSLSRSMYDYRLPEVNFVANKTYRHFTIHFQPKRKTLEQELNQGSFLILPLAVLIALASYNYQKLLPVLIQGLLNIKSLAERSSSAGGGSPGGTSGGGGGSGSAQSGSQSSGASHGHHQHHQGHHHQSSAGSSSEPSKYDISPELWTELTGSGGGGQGSSKRNRKPKKAS